VTNCGAIGITQETEINILIGWRENMDFADV
jgi:hypothetical protein